MMDAAYPASPENVPADLTTPSRNYQIHAWLALSGLAVFLCAYLGLAAWLAWTCYRLFSAASSGGDGENFLFGIGAAFLATFLLKALFFIQRSKPADNVEITAAKQPVLFEFIHKLADEIGAPRPHRVFLSASVNAGVFYDLSLLNLIFPTRKNLDIGLGLVNVLSVGEFKAVLAHEFGHFAQRTMAVGRWVYISQQIAAHIVGRRDIFDRFLIGLSQMDIRIAWVGWIFRMILWSIRSLIDLLFRVVMLAERALSREMEFQADLVSVSVTGSDALINALHKLGAADEGWARAIAFARGEMAAGRVVDDVFKLQDRIIEKTREILSDPTYGIAPAPPPNIAAGHRVFKVSFAAPPRMWSTHPANADREQNAKSRYISCAIDGRSAWILFDDSDALKKAISAQLLGKAEGSPMPAEALFDRLDSQYRTTQLKPAYRGAYLRRSTVQHARSVDELYVAEPADPDAAFGRLYPEQLAGDLEQLRSLKLEAETLLGLQEGTLEAPGPIIRHRGREASFGELPQLLKTVQSELSAVASRIQAHDSLCRSTHMAFTRRIGHGWDGHLRSLLALHHYASHAEASLEDARAVFLRTLNQELAKQATRKANIAKVLDAARFAYRELQRVHSDAPAVVPDAALLSRMGIGSWAEHLQTLKLPEPTREILSDWINACQSWLNSAIASLGHLRFVSLEQLLESEELVAKVARGEGAVQDAPGASAVPAQVALLLPGQEASRPRKQNLRERVFGGDGIIPMAARIGAAACVVGLVVWGASHVGHSTVTVYNGLGRTVHTALGKHTAEIPPFGHRAFDVGDAEALHVQTMASDGRLIEEFDRKVSRRGAHDVYNVLGAGVLVSWRAVYGNEPETPPSPLGAPRWVSAHAEVEFEAPPTSVKTKGGGASRTVLTGLGGEAPRIVLGPIRNDEAEIARVIAAHVLWDEPSTPHYADWQKLAERFSPRIH